MKIGKIKWNTGGKSKLFERENLAVNVSNL